MENLTFITGAVRSGKSLLAEQLAAESGLPVGYMATMRILDNDPEQVKRLQLHRARRPASWKTIDAPFAAHEAVEKLPASEACIIFDCLSLYTTNMLVADPSVDIPDDDPYSKEDEVLSQIDLLLSAMSKRAELQFLVVSNEVGWGIVPETRLGRAFRDFLGLANQKVAAQSEIVFLCCAGLKIQIK